MIEIAQQRIEPAVVRHLEDRPQAGPDPVEVVALEMHLGRAVTVIQMLLLSTTNERWSGAFLNSRDPKKNCCRVCGGSCNLS